MNLPAAGSVFDRAGNLQGLAQNHERNAALVSKNHIWAAFASSYANARLDGHETLLQCGEKH